MMTTRTLLISHISLRIIRKLGNSETKRWRKRSQLTWQPHFKSIMSKRAKIKNTLLSVIRKEMKLSQTVMQIKVESLTLTNGNNSAKCSVKMCPNVSMSPWLPTKMQLWKLNGSTTNSKDLVESQWKTSTRRLRLIKHSCFGKKNKTPLMPRLR